jgi:hypothetical protein
MVPYYFSAAQLSANNTAPPQLSAASTERRITRMKKLIINSAPHQLSTVFFSFFTLTVHLLDHC